MRTSRRVIAVSLVLLALLLAGAFGLWLARVEFAMTDGRHLRASSIDAAPRDVLWEPPQPLPHWNASELDEYEPHISFDGATMLLVRGRAGANADIYIARREGLGWTAPEPLTDLNSDADDLGPELSHDGQTLIFSSNRESPDAHGGFDLYRSEFRDGRWSEPQNLGPGINTHWNEHDPALSPDGAALYFSSNRPREGVAPAADGRNWPATIRQDSRVHDYDIFFASLDQSARWQARSLVAANSPFNDGAGAVSPAGDFLYFASDRPSGRGGLDLYRIRIQPPGDWPVENIGAPINTAANELDPALTAHGFALQFSSDRALADSAEPAQRYTLYESISREVYPDMRLARIDWAALWAFLAPWLTWLLLALLLALLILLLARLLSDARWKGRWRALSLLTRCLILSALVHLLLLALFTIWQVSSAITSLLDGRGRTEIAFISSDSGAGVEAQILAPLTDIQSPALDVDLSRPAVHTPPTQPTLDPLRAPVAESEQPLDALHATIDAREAPVAISPPPIELAAASPADPALAAPESTPARATAEAQPESLRAQFTDSPAPVQSQPAATPELARLNSPIAPSATLDTLAAAPIELSQSAPAPPADSTAPISPSNTQPQVALPQSAERPRTTSESAAPALTALRATPSPAPPQVSSPSNDASVALPPIAIAARDAAAAPARTAPSSAPQSLPPAASDHLATTAQPLNLSLPESSRPAAPAESTAESTDAPAIPLAQSDSRPAPALAESPSRVERLASRPVAVSPTEAPPAQRSVTPLPALPTTSQPRSTRTAEIPTSAAPLDALAMPSAPAQAQSADASTESNQPELRAPAFTSPRPRVAQTDRPIESSTPATFAPARIATAEPSPQRPPPGAASLSNMAPAPMQPSTLALNLPRTPIDFPIPADPAPTIYPQRAPEARQALVEKGGGGAETEEAVQRSLAWLARAQHPDGSWNGRDFDHACADCDGRASYDFQSAMTGLALLCFLGADNTHMKDGPYQHTVRRGLDFLKSRQAPSGDLRAGETLYSHGIASIALAEAYGMTRDPELRDPVQRAIDFIAASRSRRHGGWRYEPRQAGDTSVLGWQIMALESARRCGINVPADAIDEARAWLARVSTPGAPGLYSYQPMGEPTESMTAEGLFVRQLVGLDTTDSRASVAFIMRNMPTWRGAPGSGATYYWYYATLALYQHPGEEWGRWNRALMPILLERQRTDGDAAGSWDPSDRWSEIGGRIYQTALCTLMLEVYYRYLPTYLTADRPEATSAP